MDVTGSTPTPTPTQTHPPSITLATLGELLAYAGAAAALAAAGIVVVQRSGGSTSVLLVTFAVSAVALLAVGWVAGDNVEPRRRRLRLVLWWLSLNAAEEFVAVLLLVEVKMGARGAFVLVGALSSVYAFALWLACRSVLQQLGLFMALIVTLVAITFPSLSSFRVSGPDVSLIAVALLFLGGAWFVLGQLGVMAPRRTARVLGTILLLIAPYLFVANNGTSALVFVAIVAAMLLVAGEIVGDVAVVGIAIAGIIVGVTAAVEATTVGSSSKSLVMLIVGVVALAVSILLLRAGETAPQAAEVSPPPTPPAERPEEPPPPPTA